MAPGGNYRKITTVTNRMSEGGNQKSEDRNQSPEFKSQISDIRIDI